MQTLNQDDQVARVNRATKSDCKQQPCAQLSEAYQKEDLKSDIKRAFESRNSYDHESGLALAISPFRCCQMPNFIGDEHFLEGLRNELSDLICYEKNNDLYKFHQTDDLHKASACHIKAVRQLFCEEFRAWMSAVTGIEFTDRVDLSCSKYEYTDILLCHDDELDTRRVAFALYLTPSWSKEDGGRLDLFDMDEYGQPRNVVKSLIPSYNSLSWFEVCEASHHQVSEVLCTGKTRLSVHGWLHSAPTDQIPRHVESLSAPLKYVDIEEEMVYEWLNPVYLKSDVQEQIREKFEADSEIELQGFLKEEKYQELAGCLKSQKSDCDAYLEWRQCGPPNKRNYEKLVLDKVPDVVRNCIQFLQSEAFFLILSNLTGLRLHRLAVTSPDSDEEEEGEQSSAAVSQDVGEGAAAAADGAEAARDDSPSADAVVVAAKRRRLTCSMESVEEKEEKMDDKNCSTSADAEATCDPKCRYEVRKWKHGAYTLVHDTDLTACEFALDAIFFCCCKGWQKDYGGYTSYIAEGEDEELLTVIPVENSLALVYRDKETLRFVKHVNHRAAESAYATDFVDFAFTYYE